MLGPDCVPVVSEEFDASPALFNPFIDPDTGLLLLWARGETSIRTFDVGACWSPGAVGYTPTLLACTPFKGLAAPSVGLAALPKRCVDVRAVEIARVLRLSASTIEPLQFTVTRASHLKSYFQAITMFIASGYIIASHMSRV